VATESYSTQDVDFEKTLPVIVIDLLKRFYLKDSRVIHQNIRVWKAARELVRSPNCSDICGYTFHLASNARCPKLVDRLVDPLFRPPVYDN
jgi:hypothetical protein